MKNNHWNASNISDQKGRIVIVTGSSSGIGLETARILAGKNATVVIAVRNLPKGNAVADQIKKKYENAAVSVMRLDLSDLSSVREFAKNFKKTFSRLDILINNAGVMVPPFSKTADGFELQMGTNHFGHFALTGLLLDTLKQTPDSRVVNVSSMAHKIGNVDLNDLHWENRKYKKWDAYGDSKIANLYFTYALQQRLSANGKNPMVTASHPGWTATELQRNTGFFNFFNRFFAQDISMGALPTLRAACDPDISSGDFIGPSGLLEVKGYPVKVPSNKQSHDPETAKELWDASEELTGVKFNFED